MPKKPKTVRAKPKKKKATPQKPVTKKGKITMAQANKAARGMRVRPPVAGKVLQAIKCTECGHKWNTPFHIHCLCPSCGYSISVPEARDNFLRGANKPNGAVKLGKKAKPMTMAEAADTLGVTIGEVRRGIEAVEWLRLHAAPGTAFREVLAYVDALHKASFEEDRYRAFQATRQFTENGK